MKTLTKIRLINWHHFSDATISVHGTTYFIGANGAGKSTILDAVQFALVGGQRDVKFNVAAVAGGKRTLSSYVRGEMGTEGRSFLRGDATGVVALEFKNEDGSWFVHGAVIDAYEDGRSPDVAYFIVHQAQMNDDWFFQSVDSASRRLLDTRLFKRHIDHFRLPVGARAQVFRHVEEYRHHLLNRLGHLRDTFPAKIVKGLAFSPLTDIRAFVHYFLLDEKLVDVKMLQENLEKLRQFEELAANVRERIAALDKIAEFDSARVANRRLRIANGYVRRSAEVDRYATLLRQYKLDFDEARLMLSRIELAREEIAEQIKHADNDLFEAKLALQNDHAAIREKNIRERITSIQSELETARSREAHLLVALGRERSDLQKLCRLLVQAGDVLPQAVVDFDLIKNADLQPVHIQSLAVALDALGGEYAGEYALLVEQGRVLRNEAERLAVEIRQLKSGQREAGYESEAPEAAHLRRLLCDKLQLSSGDVRFLCDVLEVPDDGWQDAIEGVLGVLRFTLLVPPARYDDAMQIYRRLRHEQNLHGVGVLDAERVIASVRERRGSGAHAQSLATEIATNDAAARAFVDLVLGGYVKCDQMEEMRKHRTAVTRECFVRRNFSTVHLNPYFYKRWFIGSRALPRRIEERETRLGEIAVKLAALQSSTHAANERLALTQGKVRAWIAIELDLPALAHAAVLASQLDELHRELAALDIHSVSALRDEVQRCQLLVDDVKERKDTLLQSMGQQKNRVEMLSQEKIPEQERAIESARRTVDAFLVDEGVESLREELDSEYAHRRERQPIEVILTNSARYEGDYQSGEMRCRDKLREAKQAYSIRYNFGGDGDGGDEGAARYAAERERFVQTELPEYEAKISEGRAKAEQELVENFIHKLAEQIHAAREQLDNLNGILQKLRFGGERFEFVTHVAPAYKLIYDMLMDSESEHMLGDSLFETDFRKKHPQAWDLLFEKLTRSDEMHTELREMQDYRNYLEYDIRVYYPNGDRALFSRINAKKSGGETTTPFYVAMAASFMQAYRLNQSRESDTIRLALFDEAFSKMDTARTAGALQFMRDVGLQVLLATPPDKSGALLQYVDSVRTVVKKDTHSFVIEMDRDEMQKHLNNEL